MDNKKKYGEITETKEKQFVILPKLAKVDETMQNLKNRKSPKPDKSHNELLEYDSYELLNQTITLFAKIIEQHKIGEF